MDKQEATNALTEFKTFLSKLTGSKEKVEEVVVEAELSEVVEDTVEETVEAAAEEVVVVEEPVEAELSAETPSYITSEQFELFQTELTKVLDTLTKEKAELTKEVTELSAQPATEAIVHSPELSSENKSQGRTFGHKRPTQYIDKVLGKLNKYN